MRIHAVATLLLWGCSSEIAERPPRADPTSAASQEAPFHPIASQVDDPLLSPIPPRPPVRANEPAHSSTAAPPGQAPVRDTPGEHHHIYTCPMHPEVRSDKPGQCPKCGMTLVPLEATE
jgi:hypothetical protein